MKTDTPSLYVNDNGMICCIAHGGAYLQSEYRHAPERFTYRTPLDSWEKVDEEYIAGWTEMVGAPPACEMCG